MPRSCRQCSEIIGPSDLSLDCANPRCTATCHAQCSAAATFVDDGGGRLPRWRCPDCRLASPKFVSQGGYEPVYGRPRAGDTIRRASINQDWTVSSTALNRPSQLPLVRDKSRLHPSSHRASTGALLDIEVSKPSTASSEVRKTSNPIARPRSVILTPTEEEKQFENQPLPKQKQKMSENSSSPVKKDETTAQTVRPSEINLAAQNQHYGVPISVYSPDEKYEDTVKSFYNWLEQHECRSHDKPKRGGLVADKIAQFGEKLESHLSTRQRSDIPKKSNLGTPKQYPAPKSSADRKISPEDFLDEDNGTKASEIAKKKWTTDVGNARGPTTKGQNTQSSDSIPAPPPIADINVSAGYPGTKLATVQESFGPEIGSRSSVRAPVAPKMDPNMKKFSGTNPTNELDTDVASYSGQTSRKLNPPVVHETSPKTAECKMQKAPKTINPENISDGIMEIREMRVPKSSANHQKVVHEPLFNDVLDIPCKSLADLPPPPPSLLETDLDEKLSDVEIPGRVSDNGETCTNDNKCEIEDIVRVEPMKLHDGFQVEQKGEDKLSSGQQGVHQDSRIVQHSTLPVRGQFTAKIEDSGRIVQGVLVQEVDEGQPCLACEKCQGFEPHQWR